MSTPPKHTNTVTSCVCTLLLFVKPIFSLYIVELNVLKRKGLFSELVPVLVVEDSVPGLGSGGSTLNALLIVAEHLCAKTGCTVLKNEILTDARILIVHTVIQLNCIL